MRGRREHGQVISYRIFSTIRIFAKELDLLESTGQILSLTSRGKVLKDSISKVTQSRTGQSDSGNPKVHQGLSRIRDSPPAGLRPCELNPSSESLRFDRREA
jgi:hypothetical protein